MATDSTRRLHHTIPPWIAGGAVFHIRIRADREWARTQSLIAPPSRGHTLLDSVAHYHRQRSWYCHLFLLMPDHTHALLGIPPDRAMSRLEEVARTQRPRRMAAELLRSPHSQRRRARCESRLHPPKSRRERTLPTTGRLAMGR